MKANALLLIPCILFPYMFPLGFILLFRGREIEAFFGYEGSFPYFFVPPAIALLVFIPITLVACHCGITKKWSGISFTRVVMIVKLVQIPAYIINFVLGAMLFITVFTFVMTFIIIIADIITVAMSGMLNLAAIHNSKKEGLITETECTAFSILGFIFCVDVIASVVSYTVIKKRTSNKKTVPT